MILKNLSECKNVQIFVRDRSTLPTLKGYVRISAGTHKDAQAIVKIITSKPVPPPAIQSFYTPKNKIILLRNMFQRMMSVLSEAGIEFWLCGGSLLGSIRHGGIIPWDDDIDIGYVINSDEDDPIQNLHSKFSQVDLVLRRNVTNNTYWQLYHSSMCGEEVTVYIDLFAFVLTDDHYTCCDPRFRHETPTDPNAHCNIKIGKSELYPLQDGKFYNHKVKIPNKAHDILTRALHDDYLTCGKIRTHTGILTHHITDKTSA